MSGIKTYVQTSMQIPATEEFHLVRLKELKEVVAGMDMIFIIAAK